MKGWKDSLQVRDLDPRQQIEVCCRACGHVHYLTQPQLLNEQANAFLYLSEVERRARCRVRGCGGNVRIMLVRKGETKGFVGGIA